MSISTRFILDSGDPDEYRAISILANSNGQKLWGGTTNPTLIAKSASRRIAGQKFTDKEAFELQKKIVLELLTIVPGAVSAEVYADPETKASEMIQQGKEIASWDKRIYVKLPTTIEGFKARSQLRKEKIPINNTLVFSQEQIFAICLHEQIMQNEYELIGKHPCFISPFVGRLDDIGIDGMTLVENGMKIKEKYSFKCWMLEASVRQLEHMQRGILCKTELITAPAKVYKEWFMLTNEQKNVLKASTDSKPIKQWWPDDNLLSINSEADFFKAIESNILDISHPLTDQGIIRFASDWKSILIS